MKTENMTQQDSGRGHNGASQTVVITDANFESTVSKNPLVVIDFWAAWCGPCRMISPIIEELAGELSNRVVFGKMDVDSNPRIPSRYHVRSIPTIMVFKDGQPVNQLVGAAPRKVLREKIVSSL